MSRINYYVSINAALVRLTQLRHQNNEIVLTADAIRRERMENEQATGWYRMLQY